MPGDWGGQGGGRTKRGIEWGKISLLAWFAIAIVWWADGHPGRLMKGLDLLHRSVIMPISHAIRSVIGGA